MTAVLNRWRTLVWVAPAVALLLVFVYYPIVENVRLSFFSWNAFSPSPIFVGLDNYTTAFDDPVFWRALLNNTFYAVASLIVQVAFALVLAAILEEFVHQRLRGFLRTIYFIPATISITVSGILFSFLYNPQFGLVNRALGAIGLSSWEHAWLGEKSTAIWSIIAMSQWQSIGYTAILFVVAIQRIPRELFEAARIDGAGAVRSFFTITIPMVREMTTLLVILTISGAFLVFN
jgi:raffinose/stachyose/melibiose transport system permease protein